MKITHEAIVFLIILGCIACVFIGYGLWTLANGAESEAPNGPSHEQIRYMREVRSRNLAMLQYESRRRDMEA